MFKGAIAALIIVGIGVGVSWPVSALARKNASTRQATTVVSQGAKPMNWKGYVPESKESLKSKLNALQYHVTQEGGTEPPFQNAYFDNHEKGLYVDVVSGEPLFASSDKFDSGTGWPSFVRPVPGGQVEELKDVSHGMVRVEVRSGIAKSHLGHVFNDGPRPTGLRYCINSASLRFVPFSQLASSGYTEYAEYIEKGVLGKPLDLKATQCAVSPGSGQSAASCAATTETAIFAGGCFWGMEDILRKVDGVLETDVGYAGGKTPNPTYADVKTGVTGHAESIRVVFNPAKVSYAELLEKWFFKMHDPTTLNQQGNDRGSQYRSAIFYLSDAQRQVAEAVKQKVEQSGYWKKPIVTEISAAGPFTLAEKYHQDYLLNNPGGYTCHYVRP